MRMRLFGVVVLSLSLCGLTHAEDAVRVAREARALYDLDEKLKAAFEKAHPGVLPESKRKLPRATAKAFDWSKHGVTGLIYAQGKTPYCWAFAAVEAFECSWRIRNQGKPVLAVQPIIDHTKENGGAPFSRGLKDLVLNGTAPFAKYPFIGKPATPRKVEMKYRAVAYGYVGDGRAVPDTDALKEALLKHGPLVVGVHADNEGFKKYKGGLFIGSDRPAAGKPPVDHAVLLVGWDDKLGAWKIKNSWNTTWGDGGHMWIKYGANNVGLGAMWIRAQSTFYQLPGDAHSLLGDGAAPFPRWPAAKAVKLEATP